MLSKYRSAIFTLVCLCFAGIAHAQTTNTNHLEWTVPTCNVVVPFSCAPLTGYKIDRGAGTGTAWTPAATAPATATSADVPAVAGQNCYRVTGTTSKGDTLPSNAVCLTNTPPEVPPGPPVLKSVVQIAYSVQPNWSRLLFVAYNQVGRVPLGTRCSTTIADGYATVPVASVKWTGSSRPQTVVAQCAAS